MKYIFTVLLPFILIFILVNYLSATETSAPHQTPFYVSKLGNNSDGSSWINAFSTIQKALDAIPDSGTSAGY